MARAFSGLGRVVTPNYTIGAAGIISVTAWVKAPGTAFDGIFDINMRFALEFDGSNLLAMETNSGGWTADMTGITVANWNHVAVTYNGSSNSNDPVFYINGNLVTTTEFAAPSSFTTTAAVAHLGNFNSGSGPFEGSIDHVAAYNVILTLGEVQTAMRRGYATRGLQRYYPLKGSATEPDHSGSALNSSSIVATSTITDGSPCAGPWYFPASWVPEVPPVAAVVIPTVNQAPYVPTGPSFPGDWPGRE